MSNIVDSPIARSDTYSTPPERQGGKVLSTLRFYSSMIRTVTKSARLAKQGKYDGRQWALRSWEILIGLERSGVQVSMKGLQNLTSHDGPVVFVANHMSTLETFVLPAIINPVKPCTFVIKPSLMDYPVFGHVMRARNPVVVSRDNPRKDLVTVLEEGSKRLESGTSIVLFPQTTRRSDFVAEEFNSLGVKLAKKAGVPVVPLALKTDAWQNGKRLKDFGSIDTSLPVYFEFGAPLFIEGNGREEHKQVLSFISSRIEQWSQPGTQP